MIGYNQRQMIDNPHQCIDEYKRVLCVCTVGILRSPTAAMVLSQPPYNYNTRSCGSIKDALVPLSEALLAWADEIVCMEHEHKELLLQAATKFGMNRESLPPIKVLNIEDCYQYRNEELIRLIAERYEEVSVDDHAT